MAWLFGFPKGWANENILKKQMGSDWDMNSNQVQVCFQHFMCFVAKTYPSHDKWIEGIPQVVHLPFKYGEGDVALTWGLWPTNMLLVGKMKQYLPNVTIMAISVEDYAGEKEEEETI